ncbi:MAG: TIGR03767 family metallophosphoesterase [Actinomycetota bacterium]|nr:TIGR03767 family metallophosphoesterase [Actinomycetota bacterium]
MSWTERELSRRRFLQAMTAAASGTLAATTLRPPLAWAVPARSRAGAAAELTTLAQTLGPGMPSALGYRPVVTGPGERHLVRGELAAPFAKREKRRVSLLSFTHLTDQHIVDAQSTSRVEFLDRYNDGECGDMPFSSAHRPQEAASARIADAMLRRMRRIRVSPATGAPIGSAICTGDNTDNQQNNELDVLIAVMDGGTVAPDSGDRARYEGIQASGDVNYWHPDPAVDDRYKAAFGFPASPGFLERALASFEAVGAGVPWFTCYGNHDGLAQGNAPVNPVFEAIGTGSRKVVGLPPGANPCTAFEDLGAVPGAPVIPVTADPDRRYLRRRQWIARHLESKGLPHGHGYSQANVDAATAYYAADHGAVRWLVLDSVNPGGFESGSIGDAQLRWLEAQLQDAQARGLLVMLFSHHGLRSMDNPVETPDPLDPTGGDLPRHRADDVLAVVSRFPCMIAWVNGHTHQNVIEPHGTFWDIGTAAHIDWPAQGRLIDVVDNRDGTLSIFTTLFDHDDDPVVSLARELSGNDPHKGFSTGTGAVEDRNCELVLRHPFRA